MRLPCPLPIGLFALAICLPSAARAAEGAAAAPPLDLTRHPVGFAALAVFVAAYLLVVGEERLRLRKGVPVILGAGLIWILISIANLDGARVQAALRANLLEFAELFLFLLSAMTFVNTLEERQVFDALRGWLTRRGLTMRGIFWATGALAFVISPVADNLTTTLVMGSVAIAVGGGDTRFVRASCVSIVVAANAGGAFSPFGDITTLMVWQKGIVPFGGFFALVLPSAVSWLVPAGIMSFSLERGGPLAPAPSTPPRAGAAVVIALFLGTIAGTVLLHTFLRLPPALGMMSGLGLLKLYGWTYRRMRSAPRAEGDAILEEFDHRPDLDDTFDILRMLERVEWDTLMFFYGVILCVGGLGAAGYLTVASRFLYGSMDPTIANVTVGLASAVIDNIPIMYAVLTMHPAMSQAQWLLVTLTAGIGGSLLSIGSAAGVALMGQARGVYTFGAHLKWTWAIALGYAAAIGLHLLLNGR
ncbi:MAG: sodium:proton antiporter NhaD [Chthonomonadales bacterium]|nr:sodium:proton antiporter NhaD [Chthonomonadales bacterium]